jgi:hypothetical protein
MGQQTTGQDQIGAILRWQSVWEFFAAFHGL